MKLIVQFIEENWRKNVSQELDLFDLADCLDDCAAAVRKFITVNSSTISSGDRRKLRDLDAKLKGESSKLRAGAISSVLTDLKDPGERLKQSTQDIKDKIANIAELNEALNMTAKLLTIAGEVLNVATNLAAAPAAIASSVP